MKIKKSKNKNNGLMIIFALVLIVPLLLGGMSLFGVKGSAGTMGQSVNAEYVAVVDVENGSVVFKNSNNESVSKFLKGLTYSINATANENYRINSIKINNISVENNSSFVCYGNIDVEIITEYLVVVPTITTENCSVVLKNADNEIVENLLKGSTYSIMATANEDYTINSIKLNNVDIENNSTFVCNGATTIALTTNYLIITPNITVQNCSVVLKNSNNENVSTLRLSEIYTIMATANANCDLNTLKINNVSVENNSTFTCGGAISIIANATYQTATFTITNNNTTTEILDSNNISVDILNIGETYRVNAHAISPELTLTEIKVNNVSILSDYCIFVATSGNASIECYAKLSCAICNGNGTIYNAGGDQIQCEICGGSGETDCTVCGGTGETSCPDCGGIGQIDGSLAPCEECGGTGGATGGTCPNCNGFCSMECPNCLGTGWDSINDEECTFCNAGCFVDCDICNGTGEIEGSVCGSCNGLGEISEPSIECETCGGSGNVPCADCNCGSLSCETCSGAGFTFSEPTDEDCSECDGAGYINATTYSITFDDNISLIDGLGIYMRNTNENRIVMSVNDNWAGSALDFHFVCGSIIYAIAGNEYTICFFANYPYDFEDILINNVSVLSDLTQNNGIYGYTFTATENLTIDVELLVD